MYVFMYVCMYVGLLQGGRVSLKITVFKALTAIAVYHF